MDVGSENVLRSQLGRVLFQQRRAGEADEDRVLQPALHLLVHVAALGAVTFVHEDVKAAMHRWRRAVEVGGIELVQERAEEPGRGGPEFGNKFRPVQNARRWGILADDPGVLHHALDLFVQFVAIGDDENSGLGIMFQQPLGEQHHEDAFAAALRVPDDAALPLANPLLCRLHARELMRTRHLLDAAVEDDEVVDQVE